MDDEIRAKLREKEALWRQSAETFEPDAPEIMVMGSTRDMLERGTYQMPDWQPHDFEEQQEFEQHERDQRAVHFKATPFQLWRGEKYATLSLFFFRFSWVPFFKLFGRLFMKKAFWFTGGNLPVVRESAARDDRYLRRPLNLPDS